MASGTLYISEFSIGADQSNVLGNVARPPPSAEQTVGTTAGSVQSAAFQNGTTLVRVHNDGVNPVAIAWGINPTAVATVAGATAASAPGTMRMSANQTEYFNVPAGFPSFAGLKLAVITAP